MTSRSDPKVLKRGVELNNWKKENTPERCPLCNREMKYLVSTNRVVDHDYATGEIRGVMCRNCNALEGKARTICVRAGNFVSNIQWLKNLIDWWSKDHKTGVYYPGTKVVNGQPVPAKRKRKRRRKK